MSSSPVDALERLAEGNRRYLRALGGAPSRSRLAMLAEHRPFAVVVGCSDGRVVPESIFDVATGELFVVRVAGNVVGPSQVGSIEYAIARFRTPLVVVLGHSDCAAVAAALESVRGERLPGALAWSPNLEAVVGPIRSAIQGHLFDVPKDADAAVAWSVEMNVRARVADLGRSWPRLADFAPNGDLAVCGALYDVTSGQVRFLPGAGR